MILKRLLNVGVIKGGSATNIVPDQAEVNCEIRSLNEDKLQAQLEHMIAKAEKAAEKYNTKIDIKVTDCLSWFYYTRN